MFSYLRKAALTQTGDSYHGVLLYSCDTLLVGGRRGAIDFLTYDSRLWNLQSEGICFVGSGYTGWYGDRLVFHTTRIPCLAPRDLFRFYIPYTGGNPRQTYFSKCVGYHYVRLRSSKRNFPAFGKKYVREIQTKAEETSRKEQEGGKDQGLFGSIEGSGKGRNPDCADGCGTLLQF